MCWDKKKKKKEEEEEEGGKKAKTTHLSRFIELNRVPFIVLHDTIISLLNFRFSYLLQVWISVSFFFFFFFF